MAEEWKEQYDYYFNKVNNANIESAKKQMDFQERMSSTSHQREVKDLIAAGLNPILSANNGASSPQGAYANVDSSAISAKFAAQNLQKELSNQRAIALMNNENALKIAREQMATNYALGVYQADKSYDASVYGSDMQKAIEELRIDNPNSLAAIVAKFVSGYLGEESTGSTGRTAGEKGLFGMAYDYAKKLYDRNIGDNSFSARRVTDMKNAIAKQKSIVAEAKRVYKEVFTKTNSKQQASDAYRKVMSDRGYYKLYGQAFGLKKFYN